MLLHNFVEGNVHDMVLMLEDVTNFVYVQKTGP